jgi:cyclic beta-1,2-glucan synthetase
MNGGPEHKSSSEDTCPALSQQFGWDDARWVAGSILDHDRMAHHAAELAAMHGIPVRARRPGPLRARFAGIKRTLSEAYAGLAAAGRPRDAVPAEEWLLDNSHIVEGQIREIADDLPRGYLVELPRIPAGKMAGYPRIFIACLDYLRHTDARLDPDSLVTYVTGYQSRCPLTIGELWAVPIMLRLGLLIVVGGVATAVATDQAKSRAAHWADRLLKDPNGVVATLSELERQSIDPGLLVELLRFLRDHDAAPNAIEWIRARSAIFGATPEELGRRLHLQRAADQLSIANAITSMRTIEAYEWRKFFERTSFVEQMLREDRDGVYAATDRECRDRCRRALERIARRSGLDEPGVARLALDLASRHAEGARAYVGYYFEHEGRHELERACEARLSPRQWVARTLVEHPQGFYFSSFFGLTSALSLALWTMARRAGLDPALAALMTLSLLFGASEIALSIVGAAVVGMLPPRLLSRLSVEDGVLPGNRTMVVVPVLLDSVETVDRLIEELEIRALGNPDPNLHFALLSDFCDASVETLATDEPILQRAIAAIARLNERRSPPSSLPKFSLFHRRRVRNDSQGCFMGWERKRGKLDELNRLILGAADTTFAVITAPTELVHGIRFVITLDADTDLPRAAAMKLVATLAHPLNRPVLNASGSSVIEGYAVIQPRVGTVPASSRRSLYARLSAGPSGLDPYTTAVSDVYQDLFGQGSYIGKAIYDVRAFARVHAGRTPDNCLLSHDLFEGIFARTALASDIELLDDQPSSYAVVANREHRWIRGDWQLLPFLGRHVAWADGKLRPNELTFLGFWKIVDNLRRSLLAPSLVCAFFLGCLVWPAGAATIAAFCALVLATPLALGFFAGLMRRARSPSSHASVWGDMKTRAAHMALAFVLLFDHAVVAIDAIARTLYRLFVSKRRFLEWQSTGLDKPGVGAPVRMWGEAPVLLASVILLDLHGGRAALGAPILACWAIAPVIVGWLSRPARAVDPASRLSADDRETLRQAARKTWRFFETFVTAEDHWLPPDNFQEEPRAVVAHRTSPTNIGLYLLSAVAARDFGYIGSRELARRLRDTIDTLEALERAEGHILNWYDTKTCKPLEPRYVSTVDSGNLGAYLWTVRQACEELVHRPIVGPESVEAVVDALGLARSKSKVSTCPPEPDEVLRRLEALGASTQRGKADPWRDVADRTRRGWLEEVDTLAPHITWMPQAPTALSNSAAFAGLRELFIRGVSLHTIEADSSRWKEAALGLTESTSDPGERAWLDELMDRIDSAAQACGELAGELRLVGERAQALADGMNFAFLFDADRSLFSIGYSVATARLDTSRYDLLATEARLASLLAIAKGDVPEKHWFHLGRARCQVGSRRALLSWSGSMFEYLMPLLVMKSYPGTLLDETHSGVVEAHRAYGKRQGVPWGVSEAAFNVMDLSMTYQYRAFGVPALGLRPGLDEDLVVAPYATALASMIRPDLATDNLRALAREGCDGEYGFYDSIDYTAARLPPGRRGVVVKTYMAHHHGMTIVAIGNALFGAPMQRRFHADPRVRATELLLEERIPVGVSVIEPPTRRAPAPVASGEDFGGVEHVGLEQQGALRAHLLGHGELTTIVTSAGTGVTTWRGLDVCRFREDSRLDPSGTFIYVRSRSTGQGWSAGFEPSRLTPSSYRATFSVDHVEIHRRDGDLETTMEVVVSPEHCVEVRRVTITNHGDKACEVDVTSYAEVVLSPRTADVAHRAFEDMFVEFEEETQLGALLATRRGRAEGSVSPWLVQMLAPESDGWGAARCDSLRSRFLGRGRDLASPEGLWSEVPSGVVKHPLDPAAILRRSVVIEPQATARVALITGMGASRAEVVELAHRYVGAAQVDRAFELAWADARVELKHLRIGAAQSFRFQRLLSFMMDPQLPLRAVPEALAARGDGRGALWALGISGDLPIVVLRVDDGVVGAICGELLLAHEFFRLNNLSMDLVFWNEEPPGYLQPLQDELLTLVQSSFAQGHLDQRGGVFVKRANLVDERERGLVLGAARVVLRTSAGSLARQLRVAMEGAAVRKPVAKKVGLTKPAPVEKLLFDNGTGGFSPDGRQYVIVGPTPAPWCNVLANAHFGTLVSERGAGFTWSENSQRYRLTPWSNDASSDPKGEAIYVRDNEGFVWSATSGTARHSASNSSFAGTTRDVSHELTVFVPPDESVKVSRLRLENHSDSPKRLKVYGYVEWVLGSSREASRITTVTEWDAELQVAFAYNRSSADSERCSFFRATAPVASATCDRAEFFGRFGTRLHPRGVERALSAASGAGLDPCAALEVPIEIPPRSSVELSFVLGDASTRGNATELARRWGENVTAHEALERTRLAWDDLLDTIQIETPDPALDLMINRWLLQQVVACRVWGRSAFYQSGGAFGFRDQLQDVLALVYARPNIAREHLLRAASRQFEQGDVQHWWHPDDGAGIRTRCSDDMLWLPFAVMEYVAATQDHGVLDQEIPFLVDRPVPPDQRDLFGRPRTSGQVASLYEHCARAIDAGLTRGAHGLPLMRGGDWNDGMDRVGAAGQGESVWLGWFLYCVIRDFGSLAASRGDAIRAQRLRAEMRRLAQSIEDHGWDGAWYRRAYFDDGTPLGSHTNSECRIDAIAQSWAVIAGAGDPRRARRAVEQAEAALVDERPPMMRLLSPAFDGNGPDPGYIRSYPAGVRENGGQYTHGVLWTVQALAMLGEGDRAHALYSKLNPILHALSREDVRRYRVEPYVVAADVYSAHEHQGRGGWTWYTGAAGWMYRIAIEWLLGLRLRGNSLSLSPCVPASWKSYSIRLRRGRTTFEIHVEPGRDLQATLDGVPVQGDSIPLADDSKVHQVRVGRAARRMAV